MQTPGTAALARTALFAALGAFTAFYLVAVIGAWRRKRAQAGSAGVTPTPLGLATGFVTNFFDTLGIGSFAPTTAIFRFLRLVPDEHIPGTLNVGHALPVIVQSFIFTTIVPVEPRTLILMIAAAVAGAWLGAGVVSSWPRRTIRLGMGLCLIAAASLMAAAQLRLLPVGGAALGVTGIRLSIAIAGNFVLGALMTLGIGLYAPCMVLVSLLGMNVQAAFPIMMGSCAFLQPVSSARFARTGAFDLRASVGLALAGIPAVLIAAYLVKSLDLNVLRWVVVCVVLYTAISLLLAARRQSGPALQPGAAT
jgi:uncharacterized membrane protein YfcA